MSRRIFDHQAPMFEAHAYSAGDAQNRNVQFLAQGEPTGIEVAAGWSTIDEDVALVMIDTTGYTGRIRIELNDGTLFDDDPEEPEDSLSPYEIAQIERGISRIESFYMTPGNHGIAAVLHAARIALRLSSGGDVSGR